MISHRPVWKQIHDFHEKLVTHPQALDTMGEVKEINRYFRLTLDKLPTSQVYLVRTNDDCQEWNFWQFIGILINSQVEI